MNKAKLIQQWTIFLNRKTKQYTPSIYKVLRDQVKYWARTGDTASIPIQPLYDVLKDIYVNTGRLWAWQTYQNILLDARVKEKKAAPLGINQEFVNAILSYFNARLLEKVDNITGTTRQWLIEQITKGQAEGLSLDEIVRNIVGNTDIPRMRAERIARTETGIAANVAGDIGAAKTGLELEKEWLSVHDARTRHPHILVDGQKREFDKPFNVGGFEMMRPGDGNTQNDNAKVAPASLIVNCRCVLGHRAKRDKDGLPIRRAAPISIQT